MAKKRRSQQPTLSTIRIDLGAGPNKREGFLGVDQHAFPGVDVVADLRQQWPWVDGSVAEAHTSHFVEHLTGVERVHFANELYRVLEPGGKCLMIVPHWASCRAYGDPTHQWPPVSEFWFYYLSKEWRAGNAPHTDISIDPKGFNCDFDIQWSYNIRPDLLARNQEYQQFAISNHKEVCQDIVATLTKK